MKPIGAFSGNWRVKGVALSKSCWKFYSILVAIAFMALEPLPKLNLIAGVAV
jgi:hypothetical protein